MFTLEPPSKVGVESRARAEEACNSVLGNIIALHRSNNGPSLQDWVKGNCFSSHCLFQLHCQGKLAKSALANAGKWLDRHIYHVLGMRGYARAVLGVLTVADIQKLAPNPKEPTGNGTIFQGGGSEVPEKQMEQVRQHSPMESGAGVIMGNRKEADRSARDLRPDEKYHRAVDAFANRLRSSAQIGWRHDDGGSRVGSSTLAPWLAGAYCTPLVDSATRPAPLAVSILVDSSGSTTHMVKDLWMTACALRNTMLRLGHFAAIDRWDGTNFTAEGPDYLPVTVGWGDPEVWRSCGDNLGSTALATSATPAMGRLQSTAPSGSRHLLVVITDGETDSTDRREFLSLAACPCVYWEVANALGSSKAKAGMFQREGWSAHVHTTTSELHAGSVFNDESLADALESSAM